MTARKILRGSLSVTIRLSYVDGWGFAQFPEVPFMGERRGRDSTVMSRLTDGEIQAFLEENESISTVAQARHSVDEALNQIVSTAPWAWEERDARSQR